MTKIPVIMDCDPGHDDALALMLAFSSEKLDVLGVTAVAGNQTLDKTSVNTLKLLSYMGIRADVAVGCAKPLMRELTTAPQVHGESGLDGPALPEPDFGFTGEHAVELIARKVRECSGNVTIIPTGPLTNIALFLSCYPDLSERIEHISLMGGAAVGGNWKPCAEFNIFVDPEAAAIVFGSGIPITMAGLDVTHKAYLLKEDIERIRSADNKVAVMAAELLEFYGRFHQETGYNGSPLHDPVAVTCVCNPSIVESKLLRVDVETRGEFTLGQTVTDFRGVTGMKPNVNVALDIDRTAFVDMLYDSAMFYKDKKKEVL